MRTGCGRRAAALLCRPRRALLRKTLVERHASLVELAVELFACRDKAFLTSTLEGVFGALRGTRRAGLLAAGRHRRARRRAEIRPAGRSRESASGPRPFVNPPLQDCRRLLVVEADHLLELLARRALVLAREIVDQAAFVGIGDLAYPRARSLPRLRRDSRAIDGAAATGRGRVRIARVAGRRPNQMSRSATTRMVAALTNVPSWRTTSSFIPTAGTGSSCRADIGEIHRQDLDLVAAVGAQVGGRGHKLLNFRKLPVDVVLAGVRACRQPARD